MRKTMEKIIVVAVVNRWVSSGNGHNKNDTHTHIIPMITTMDELFLFLYRIKEKKTCIGINMYKACDGSFNSAATVVICGVDATVMLQPSPV